MSGEIKRMLPMPLDAPRGVAQHPSIKKRKRDARKLRSRVRRSIARSEAFAAQHNELVQTQATLFEKLTGIKWVPGDKLFNVNTTPVPLTVFDVKRNKLTRRGWRQV